jgi:hypothetical protein
MFEAFSKLRSFIVYYLRGRSAVVFDSKKGLSVGNDRIEELVT